MPRINQDPDLMSDAEVQENFDALPLDQKQVAMRDALDKGLGPAVAMRITPEQAARQRAMGWISSRPDEMSEVSYQELLAKEAKRNCLTCLFWTTQCDRSDTLVQETLDWAGGSLGRMQGHGFVNTNCPGYTARPRRIRVLSEQEQGVPWPPLSREQVVDLHEALADFLSMMENGYGDGEVQDAAHAATRLESKLLGLGLGMLPVQTRPAPPVKTVTFRDALGQEVEPKPGDTIRVVEATTSAPDWYPSFRVEGDKAVDPATGAVMGTVLNMPPPGMPGTVMVRLTPEAMHDFLASQPGAQSFVVPHTPIPGVKTAADKAPKRNCWSCKHLRPESMNDCAWMRNEVSMDPASWRPIQDWILAYLQAGESTDGMPPKDSDGCPGWEPKS